MSFPAPRSKMTLRAGSHRLALGEHTLVMGILNCTPDSFSDGGQHATEEAALRRLESMVAEGAEIIDVGGESTRPGAEPVGVEEEWRRIAPVFREGHRRFHKIPLSVDTTKSEVARRALEEGVAMINDVSGLRFDPALADLAAQSGAALVLMHMKGEPRTMQKDPVYEDVVAEVGAFLSGAAEQAMSRGVSAGQLVVDPGIGFGKTIGHNLELLRRIPDLAALGYPVLVGASRKSFIGALLDLPVTERMEGSLGAHVSAALAGAHIVRAHDVRATVRGVRVADAVRGSWPR